MKVRHAGKVWDVTREIDLDERRAYELRDQDGKELTAWVGDCRPIKPRTRRIRGALYVLEYNSDGTLAIRRCRSSRRFPITLDQIYELGVRVQVFKNGRVPKHLRARGRKR